MNKNFLSLIFISAFQKNEAFSTRSGDGKLWSVSQLPAFINSFIETQLCPFVYILNKAALTLQWQSSYNKDYVAQKPSYVKNMIL